MTDSLLLLADAVALTILVFGLYFPRYRRRDMVLAIVSINIGVVAVAMVLSRADVSAGLGLGLFGVRITPDWLSPALMGAIVVALFIVDHPRLFPASRSQAITLASAFTDERVLTDHLEQLLNAQVLRMKVKRIDMVNDTTTVDVRYRLRTPDPVAR